jgi:hypothetical protein
MRSLLTGLATTAIFASASFAQAPAPAPAAPAATGQMKHQGEWRASKMIGLNVYNGQNEKIGDINEILMDSTGKAVGYVVGVGGFLGMGEHDVLVKPTQLKFVTEAVRTSAATGSTSTRAAPRAANEKWYPDHAVMDANKDQLKALPQFKYSNYN